MKKTLIDLDKNGNALFHARPESKPLYYELPREKTFPTEENMACEAQLSALGTWEPLSFKIKGWNEDEKVLENYWVPFQPREGQYNDRESILIFGIEGAKATDPCGLSQLARIYGYKPSENDMNIPTEAKDLLSCMHEVFDYFELGRTFLVRLNVGGHYPPHRDHMLLTRPTFRLIAFLGDSVDSMRWEVEDKPVQFRPNTIYYVDTRKTHRLWSSSHKSTMMVFNVMKNWENTMKVLSKLKYQG